MSIVEICIVFNLLHVTTAGCAIFLAFLVVTVRRDANAVANRWLAAFLLILGCFLLDDSFMVFGIYQSHPTLIGLASLLAFALPPTLYLSVSHFVSTDKKFKAIECWHFAPFALFVLLNLPFLLSNNSVKLMELANFNPSLNWLDKMIIGLILGQTIAYWVFSLRKLLKHRKNITQITASPGEFSLDWLLYFLYGIGGMILTWLLDLWYNALTVRVSSVAPGYFLGIWWIGYFALRQKEVFPFTPMDAAEIGEIMSENPAIMLATRRQLFSAEKLEALKQKLLHKMQTEKPYLDPDLSLPSLAHQMDLSVHEMSELVNQGFGENLAQFVNRYRLEESKYLLLSEKHHHLNMLGIAFEAGFNSKSAFNTVFKKMTGISPSEYQKQHKK